jgi:Sec7-like guanine-nucleotide exchange factor
VYVYAISFGTIMLNTDLYNEHVKYKMTLKQFIDNIQYFNTNGPPATDIPVDFLEDLYFKIEIDEIKMEKERTLLPNALKRSWMFVYAKTGMGSSRWKRRWMVLSDNCLFIFRKYDVISFLHHAHYHHHHISSLDDII